MILLLNYRASSHCAILREGACLGGDIPRPPQRLDRAGAIGFWGHTLSSKARPGLDDTGTFSTSDSSRLVPILSPRAMTLCTLA